MKVEIIDLKKSVRLSGGARLVLGRLVTSVYVGGFVQLRIPHLRNKNNEPITPTSEDLLEMGRLWEQGEAFREFLFERVYSALVEGLGERLELIDSVNSRTAWKEISLRGVDWGLVMEDYRTLTCSTSLVLRQGLKTSFSFTSSKEASEYFEEIQKYGVESASEILAYRLTRGGTWVKGG